MHMKTYPIATEPGLATYRLTAYHYGSAGSGKKVYIQASLHADEVPAMLVAHCLRRELERLDGEGRIHGEVILVPAAPQPFLNIKELISPPGQIDLNPIGRVTAPRS